MQCGCSGCGHGWWHHVTKWAGCILPPLSSHSRTREPSHEEEEEEEDGRFSVYQSLCISIKETSPCLSVWVCKWVCLPLLLLFSPPPLVAEERKRWDVVIVTVSRYSGGEWPSGEMWCELARHECFSGPSSGTLEEPDWTRSSSLSSWSRKPARPMFIHNASVLCTDSFLGGSAALMLRRES